MKADEVRDFLRQRRVEFKEGEIQNAIQFRCVTGEVINAFHSGRVVVQGKKTELTRALAERSGAVATPVAAAMRSRQEAPSKEDPSKRVFIVYGHDLAARDGLELVVRRMGLDPIVLANLPAGGDTIIEKLETYLGEHGNIGFACVLLTPDDEATSRSRSRRSAIAHGRMSCSS